LSLHRSTIQGVQTVEDIQKGQELLDQLPDDIEAQLPLDVIADLRDGSLTELPDDVVAGLPQNLQDRIPESLIETAAANSTLLIILGVVAAVSVAGFLWGVVKSAMKAAVFFAIVAAVAIFFLVLQ